MLNIAYNQKQKQEHAQEKTDRIARLEKKAKEISFPKRNPSKDHNIENNIKNEISLLGEIFNICEQYMKKDTSKDNDNNYTFLCFILFIINALLNYMNMK